MIEKLDIRLYPDSDETDLRDAIEEIVDKLNEIIQVVNRLEE